MMETEGFKLIDRAEVVKFSNFLMEYSKENALDGIQYLDLVNAYDRCQHHDNGSRIFNSVLDLKINIELLNFDNVSSLKTWKSKLNEDQVKKGSLLDSKEIFFEKMDLHRHNNAFIFRYRAIWDKIFGLLILIHAPEKYDNFLSSKSRLGSFKKIAKTMPYLFGDEDIAAIDNVVTSFDNEFRTAEAHATGRLRKFSFTLDDISKNPSMKLSLNYWNKLISALVVIDHNFTN